MALGGLYNALWAIVRGMLNNTDYFDANGVAVVRWYLINGKYYYFDENGLMQVGFVEFNGKKYYLNPNNGQMVTGWIQTYTDGVLDYYYFTEDGSMLVDAITPDGYKVNAEGKWIQ